MLSEKETEVFKALKKRGKIHDRLKKPINRLDVQYRFQGNFTIAIVIVQIKGLVRGFRAIGVSKRSPKDKLNPEIGMAVALRAALTNPSFI